MVYSTHEGTGSGAATARSFAARAPFTGAGTSTWTTDRRNHARRLRAAVGRPHTHSRRCDRGSKETNQSALIRGNPRLLLCDAVNRAHAPHQRLAINWDHAARRKTFLQSLNRALIGGVTEHWCKHDAVGDIKVRVAGR